MMGETTTETPADYRLTPEDEAALDAELGAEDRAQIEFYEAQARLPDGPMPTRQTRLYNHPNLWAIHPTTQEWVTLAGDPDAVRHYTQKGFVFPPADVVKNYQRYIRPGVLAEESERAWLITLIRELARSYTRELRLNEARDGDLGLQTTQYLRDLMAAFEKNVPAGTVIAARLEGYVSEASRTAAAAARREAGLAAGVEVGDPAQMARSRGRTVEIR